MEKPNFTELKNRPESPVTSEKANKWLKDQVPAKKPSEGNRLLSDQELKEKNLKNDLEASYTDNENPKEDSKLDSTISINLEKKSNENKKGFIKKFGEGVKHFLNKYKRKIVLTTGLSAAALSGGAMTTSNSEKIFSDSTENITQTLKQGEKFKLLPEQIEVGGITIEGQLVINTSDSTKEFRIIKFSGEGENLIGKELEALKALGFKPAPAKFLNEINPEAFKAAGSNVKAIDEIYKEGENLGQTKNILVKENDVVTIRNPIKVQSTEVGMMTTLGTTFNYATIVYKDKAPSKNTNYPGADLATK